MAEESNSIAKTIATWVATATGGLTLVVGVLTVKDKLGGKPDTPAGDAAPVQQVTRVEVVHSGIATPPAAIPASPNVATDDKSPPFPASGLVGQSTLSLSVRVEARENKQPSPPRLREQKAEVPQLQQTKTTEYLVARATGNGPSFASAASSAIAQALSMRLGAQVSSDVLLALKGESVSTDKFDSSNYRETLGAHYSSASKGLVKWWDWEKEEVQDGRYEITVVAILAKKKPKVADPSGRKIVAVLPFSLDQDFSALAAKIERAQFGRSISEAASNHLTQGRKFQVVAGSLEQLASKAANLGASGLQATVEAAEALEADFVIMGEAERLEVSRFRPGQGVLPNPVASGSILFKVLKVENGQTVLSKRFDLKDIRPDVLVGSKVAASVADALGVYISNQLHDTVFPIKVLAINGDSEVVLNRGGDALVVGDVYELFTMGPIVKDPDTGESLQIETKSGEITISRITPKMSYGTVSSRIGSIVLESLCRKKL